MEVADTVENTNHNRHLDNQRQATGQGVNAFSFIKVSQFQVQTLFIVFVLSLDFFHFRLNFVHSLHGFDLFFSNGVQSNFDDNGHQDNCNTIAGHTQSFSNAIHKSKRLLNEIAEEVHISILLTKNVTVFCNLNLSYSTGS